MSYDKNLENYGPLTIDAIPVASVYQEHWQNWEYRYRVDVRTWRRNLVAAINRRLAAPESAPDVSAEGPRLTVVRTQLEQALLLLEENPDEPMPDPWRNNVINRVERALEYLPPAGEDDTIATLQQWLAV